MDTFYTGGTGIGSGPHLDFRVYDPRVGDYIDPSGFTDILLSGGKPVADQFRMSSGFGPRAAPVAGASTDHKGIDYATPSGTPITIKGGEYLTTFTGPRGGIMSQYGFMRDGKPYEALLLHGSDQNKITGKAARTDYTGQAVVPLNDESNTNSQRADAKKIVQDYANMSKAELNAAYDAIRNTPTGAEEGMKMHKAFFRKG